MRLRFAELHFMIVHGFLSSYAGRGGLWELCSLSQRGTPVRSFAEKKHHAHWSQGFVDFWAGG